MCGTTLEANFKPIALVTIKCGQVLTALLHEPGCVLHEYEPVGPGPHEHDGLQCSHSPSAFVVSFYRVFFVGGLQSKPQRGSSFFFSLHPEKRHPCHQDPAPVDHQVSIQNPFAFFAGPPIYPPDQLSSCHDPLNCSSVMVFGLFVPVFVFWFWLASWTSIVGVVGL